LKKAVDPLGLIDCANVCTSHTIFSQWLEKHGIQAVFLSFRSGLAHRIRYGRLELHQSVAGTNVWHGTELGALLLESAN
jgi:hypothetical protein